MSHTAIAAVLARPDLSIGERLVALSLASFANRDDRAFPGNAAAAARAGLGRSRYLAVREQLVTRGLIAVESAGRGRGQATTLITLFAQSGPWWDGDINARLLEHVLGRSPLRGPARLLLGTLAALADASGVVDELSTDDLCRAAGLANSTYRRARSALLASGEVKLVDDGGGRGRMNRWRVFAPAGQLSTARSQPARRQASAPRQPPPLAAVRPELAPASGVAAAGGDAEKGPGLSGVMARKGPGLSGVSPEKGPDRSGVSRRNPANTPPQTPPSNARTVRESLNPRIRNPPDPPEGGSTERWVIIEEDFVSDRGRRRRRPVRVDLDEVRGGLDSPSPADLCAWRQIRDRLGRRVGESMFDIWLEPVELIAIDSDHRLVLAAPAAMASWTSARFGWLIASAASEVGRDARFANEGERRAFEPCAPSHPISLNQKEAAG
ncbi:MAG: DnaA N-terminal domain-containing protein [Solirubrobacteraceae bacterium]